MGFTYVLLVCLAGGAYASQASPFELIRSSNWEDRYDGTKMLLANYSLSDPAVQRALINLLQRESDDPKWEEDEESLTHEDYYDDLLSGAVQKIATTYHNKAAFFALTHSNYNADSEFGRWLATQPGAFPILLAQTKDHSNPVRNGLAHQVLAFAILFCRTPDQKQTCGYIDQRYGQLMANFRSMARDPGNENRRVTGTMCLSICGTKEDLAWMRSIAQTATDAEYKGLLRLLIPNLEQRLQLPPSPSLAQSPATAH